MFPGKICHDRRSPPGRGNLPLADTCRGQTAAADRDTGRGYLLSLYLLTAYLEGCLQFEKDGLLHEDLLAFMAEPLDFSLEQVDLLGYFRVANR